MSKVNMPDFLTKMCFTTNKVAKANFYKTCYEIGISAGTLLSAFIAKVNEDPSFIKQLGFEEVEHDYDTNDGEILDNTDYIDPTSDELEEIGLRYYANQRNKESYKGYCFSFDKEDDQAILKKLDDVPNKKQYVLNLIRQDLQKGE